MSLLTIIQAVSKRLALPVPSVIVTSTDKQVLQLWELANEEGLDQSSRYRWQALVAEKTFVTTATQAQAAALPADFDRFIPNSFFNRSTRRPIIGPITPRQWQWIQAQPVFASVYLAFRERTGQFLMTPTPPAGQTIAYEYVSLNWAKAAAGGAGQSSFLADGDATYLDEELVKLGLRWRFLRAKGLDYAEEMTSYERNVEQGIARDGGATALSMTPGPIDASRINLPDGNFGMP